MTGRRQVIMSSGMDYAKTINLIFVLKTSDLGHRRRLSEYRYIVANAKYFSVLLLSTMQYIIRKSYDCNMLALYGKIAKINQTIYAKLSRWYILLETVKNISMEYENTKLSTQLQTWLNGNCTVKKTRESYVCVQLEK